METQTTTSPRLPSVNLRESLKDYLESPNCVLDLKTAKYLHLRARNSNRAKYVRFYMNLIQTSPKESALRLLREHLQQDGRWDESAPEAMEKFLENKYYSLLEQQVEPNSSILSTPQLWIDNPV